MAAKNLNSPEWFHGSNPAVMRVMKLKVGLASTDDVVVGAAGTYALFNVPAGTIVHDIQWLTLTSIKATGGTLKVGDTGSDSGYFHTTQIGALGIYDCAVLGNVRKHGRYYAAAGNINLKVATKPFTAGEAEVYLWYSKAHADV